MHPSPVRFQHFHREADDGEWGGEFSARVPLRQRELPEEALVDLAKDILRTRFRVADLDIDHDAYDPP